MRKYRVNADLWTVLADLLTGTPEEFNSDRDSLRGRALRNSEAPAAAYVDRGRLPDSEWNVLSDSVVSYVIYSYGTPIAYRRVAEWGPGGQPVYEWVAPEVRYSVTTTKHQGKVCTALSRIETYSPTTQVLSA